MTAQIKVRVQRKAIVKLKVLLKFPADVIAGSGMVITRSGRTYTFSLDPAALLYSNFLGITITPPALSTQQAIKTTQFSPTTGSQVGPLIFNQFSVNNQYGTTPGGVDNPLKPYAARGWVFDMVEGGPNIQGYQEAMVVSLHHTVGPSDILNSDHIALVTVAYSNQTAAGHGLYGANVIAWADAGSSHGNVVGTEFEAHVKTGATGVQYKIGVRSNAYGELHGSVLDAAYTVAGSEIPWNTAISIGEAQITGPAISTTGSIISAARAITIQDGLKLDLVTITGDAFVCPHVKISGNGTMSLDGQDPALAYPSPIANAVLKLASSGSNEAVLEIDGYGNTSSIALRAAAGTYAALTALAADFTMGAVGAWGYGTTGYSSASRAALLFKTSQIWTDANQGTYIDVQTTASNTTTRATALRFENDGGVTVPNGVTGGSKGAGTLNATGLYIAGVAAITAPSTKTLTNTTLDTAGAGNSFLINGVAVTANTGTGAVARAAAPTFTTPALGAATATSINGNTLTTGTGTLTLTSGAALTASTTTSVGRGQYLATNTNDNATAGNLGEELTQSRVSASAISLTTGVLANITASPVTLTAGDWELEGIVYFQAGATTNATLLVASMSNTSATLDTTPGRLSTVTFGTGGVTVQNGLDISVQLINIRVSITANTDFYLVGRGTFTVDTLKGWGFIRARRAR